METIGRGQVSDREKADLKRCLMGKMCSMHKGRHLREEGVLLNAKLLRPFLHHVGINTHAT
jgi:hypothetical protein